jgi:hypothetical protein
MLTDQLRCLVLGRFFGWLVQANLSPTAFSIQPSSILANRLHPQHRTKDDDDDEEDWDKSTISDSTDPRNSSVAGFSDRAVQQKYRC